MLMTKKNLKLLASALGFIFLFYSCRTDEMVNSEQRTQNEKIGAFERFENQRSQEILNKKTHSSKSGVPLPLSYSQPFSEIIYQFLVNHPDFYDKLSEDFGEIDYNVASQTFGEDKKYIFYPILKDGKVTSLWYGKLNEDRSWVDFYLVHDTSASTQRMIGEFQNYYSKKMASRGEPDPPVKEIPEIIITPPSTNPPIHDPIPSTGGDGTYTPPYTGDMSGGPIMHGGGYGTNTTQDPCKKAESSMTSANTILKNSEVQQKMDVALKEKVQASNEWSVAIGQKPNGQYEVTPPVEQSASNGTIPTSQLTSPYIGDGHSHAGSRGNPSGGDLYHMITSLADNPALKYRFVYGNSDEGTAETYALVINNASLAQQFLSQYPKDENYNSQDHSIKKISALGIEFYKADMYYLSGASDNSSGENYDSRAVAMAYILDKFNAGISVAKADTNGNLKKINADVVQITIPYSGGKVKEGVKVSKCP